MVLASVSKRAPTRGRYDRDATPEARAAAARGRLVVAAVAVLDDAGPLALTVERVIREAGMGRNTFYTHFTDVAALADAAMEYAVEALFAPLEAALGNDPTPAERLRRAMSAFLGAIEDKPAMARVALGAAPSRGSADPVERWCRTLGAVMREANAAGLASLPPERGRVRAVAGACCAVGSGFAREPSTSRERTTEMLVDLTLRAFR